MNCSHVKNTDELMTKNVLIPLAAVITPHKAASIYGVNSQYEISTYFVCSTLKLIRNAQNSLFSGLVKKTEFFQWGHPVGTGNLGKNPGPGTNFIML